MCSLCYVIAGRFRVKQHETFAGLGVTGGQAQVYRGRFLRPLDETDLGLKNSENKR